jgi:hypothetical protein
MIGSFLAGSLLTLFVPVGLLIVIGIYWLWIARRRDEF